MIRNLIGFVVVILCTIYSSCGSKVDSQLDAAEHIMEVYPDSAMVILNNLDANKISNDAEIARYSLLYTQACVKLDYEIPNDSIISIAYDYFDNYGDHLDMNKMKSAFYKGWVNYSKEDFSKAIHYATEALDIAAKLDNPFWSAKTSELLYILLTKNYSVNDALKYNEIAAENYLKNDNILNYYYCIVDKAILKEMDNRYEEALELLNGLPQEAWQNKGLLAYSDVVRLDALYSVGEYAKADSVFNRMLQLEEYYPIGSCEYRIKILLLVEQHNYSEIPYYMHLGDSMATDDKEKNAMLNAKIYSAIQQGDTGLAFHMAEQLNKLLDEDIKRVTVNSLESVQRDFYENKAIRENIEHERKRLILRSLLTMVLIVFAFVMAFVRIHIKAKNIKIKALALELASNEKILTDKLNESNTLSELIATKNDVIDSLTRKIGDNEEKYQGYETKMACQQNTMLKTLQQQWRMLSELGRAVLQTHDENDLKRATRRLLRELDNLRSEKNFTVIEKIVNEVREGLADKARKNLKNLREKDFRLLFLLYSGMDNQLVCIYLNVSPNSIGSLKSRLKKRILTCDCSDADYYIRLMD